MPPVWLHCNLCRRTPSQFKVSLQLHMTNCGLVFCSGCGATRLARRVCRACHGRCKRSLPLNGKAPREVKALFEDLGAKIRK